MGWETSKARLSCKSKDICYKTKDGMTLADMRMLVMEGHDIPLDWHLCFLSEDKIIKTFINHWIRRSLLKSWRTVKPLLYPKIVMQMSPLEAIS